jgi:hypothetical protein
MLARPTASMPNTATTTAPPAGTWHAASWLMGMLLTLALLAGISFAGALFVHALRADPSERAHGWLVVVPLLIVAGWILGTLIMG